MSALRTIGLRLGAGWALLLSPLAVQAAVHLYAPSHWYRGEPVTIEARADADTPVNTFEFHSRYAPLGQILEFLGVLELKNDPKVTLPKAIECETKSVCFRFEGPGEVEDSSTFVSAVGGTLPKGTVVQWTFLVKANADLGEVNVPLNVADGPFVVEADGIAVNWMDEGGNKEFQILARAVPESSSWVLMLVGLAAVGARAYRRKTGA